eukprot:10457686-Ditylum_brightwellii.AAC.1
MWASLQDEYLYDSKFCTRRLNGAMWAKQVIKLIWQQFLFYGCNAMRFYMDATTLAFNNINKKFYS